MNATQEKPAVSRPAARAKRCHIPGGAALGQEHSREVQRLAAAILEVLAGARTPAQAASALNVSLPRYYQVEARALRGLVAACAPRPRGPGHSAEREVEKLRRQQERLERELTRQQTLVRLAQRSIGLAPPPAPAKDGSKKRRPRGRCRRPPIYKPIGNRRRSRSQKPKQQGTDRGTNPARAAGLPPGITTMPRTSQAWRTRTCVDAILRDRSMWSSCPDRPRPSGGCRWCSGP